MEIFKVLDSHKSSYKKLLTSSKQLQTRIPTETMKVAAKEKAARIIPIEIK